MNAPQNWPPPNYPPQQVPGYPASPAPAGWPAVQPGTAPPGVSTAGWGGVQPSQPQGGQWPTPNQQAQPGWGATPPGPVYQQLPVQPTPPLAQPKSTASMSADGVLTVKPNARLFYKSNGARLLLALPVIILVVMFGYRGRSLSAEVRLTIALVTLVVIAVWLACVLFVSRVQVTRDELVVRNSVGFSRRYRREQLGFALLLVQYRSAGQGALTTVAIVAGQDGRRLLRMPGQYWDRNGIDRFLHALALPRVDVIAEPITAKLVDARYPKLLPFGERRPGMLALVIVLATFALIGALAAIAIAVT